MSYERRYRRQATIAAIVFSILFALTTVGAVALFAGMVKVVFHPESIGEYAGRVEKGYRSAR